jgi:hypothetical protein
MNANVTTIRPGTSSAEQRTERKIKASMPFEEQLATLQALIRKPPTNTRVIEFSPQLAEYILVNLNPNNRNRKPAKIKQYAEEMAAGSWGLTGDTIKFGNNGELRDGQNRLAGSVRAGVPFESHVVFGIDPELFSRMDIGKNRSGGDVLKIAGIKYPNHVANAVRWLLILTGEDPTDRGAQFSNDELLTAYREKLDPERLEDSVHAALKVRKTTRHPVGPLAALHYLFAQRDQKKADEFYDEWATGRAKRVRAPSRALQNRLVEIARNNDNRMHENVRNGLIVKAWNAYVAGRSAPKAYMSHTAKEAIPAIAG